MAIEGCKHSFVSVAVLASGEIIIGNEVVGNDKRLETTANKATVAEVMKKYPAAVRVICTSGYSGPDISNGKCSKTSCHMHI